MKPCLCALFYLGVVSIFLKFTSDLLKSCLLRNLAAMVELMNWYSLLVLKRSMRLWFIIIFRCLYFSMAASTFMLPRVFIFHVSIFTQNFPEFLFSLISKLNFGLILCMFPSNSLLFLIWPLQ